MITIRVGNIFDSEAQTIVNTVNCVGIMGKGIALAFKKRFPDMYSEYVNLCNSGHVKLGKPYLHKRMIPPWILNFPTKSHWRAVSKLSDIIDGIRYLIDHYQEWGIQSIAIPPLGCGQGQLDWTIVGPTLYRLLKDLDIPVELYAPYGTSDEMLNPAFLDRPVENDLKLMTGHQKIKPAWIAMVEVLRRIQQEPYHWEVGRTRFQKIAYFVTESGLPTGFKYQKSSYGPYSPDLKNCITKLVNNGLIKEQKIGRMFAVRVGPTYGDARNQYISKIIKWDDIIDKITDLFIRTDTRQSEIVATIHFATKDLISSRNELPSEMDVLNAVLDWKQNRRPPLSKNDIASAIRLLNLHSWIAVNVSKDLPLDEFEYADVY